MIATIVYATAVGTISQNRLYSDNMILESRESYDVRPFIAGFGTKPGESVVVTFGGTHTMSYPTYNATVDAYPISQIWTTPDAVRAAPRKYQ
jgi:arginase family enzyme